MGVKLRARGVGCARAVLTGGAGILAKRTLSYHIRVKAYRAVKKIAPRYAEKAFGSAEYRTLSPLMRESYKKIVNEDLREDAKRIARPVLFVVGEKDTATPPQALRVYHECVRGS